MGFSCGIVGLPNAGKSTFFNGLMMRVASESANYPFCTIEPHRGQVIIPDERLVALTKISHSKETIPAVMEVVDIAGLVRGASKGEGLGNLFLSHIREVDAIAHVVRCYEGESIIHVETTIDPLRDVEIIDTELMLADMATLQSMRGKIEKKVRSQDKESKALLELLERMEICLNDGRPARLLSLDEVERDLAKQIPLLTLKPVLYVANVTEGGDGGHATSLFDHAALESALCLSVPCGLEAEIAALEKDQRADYREALGVTNSALSLFLQKGYELLGLQSFFTSAVKETRAWSCLRHAAAPQAAGVIHGDFERGFIAAEVVSYEDFISCDGWEGAKAKGKMRVQGRDYIMNDGDVVLFRFNV